MVWNVNFSDGTTRTVKARDETGRDGGQGEAARSAKALIEHILESHQWYDMMTIGWPYVHPVDKEAAQYLRDYLPEMQKTYPDLTRDKFFVYSLVYRGKETEPGDVNPATPFGMMLQDMLKNEQPYGTVNVLTKARVHDLQDFGEHTTSESFNEDMAHTLQLLHKANKEVRLEIALEHVYTAWLEDENQQANRKHVIDTMVVGLLNGAVGITVPDTDGAHEPEDITLVLTSITKALQEDKRLLDAGIHFDPSFFIAHMHDDELHAALNTKAAIKAGAGYFDSTAGVFGERKGNLTIGDAAITLKHPDKAHILGYQRRLAAKWGAKPGDKDVGAWDAFGATGGMHADHVWKEFLRARQEQKDISFRDFIKTYNGSYATVPAQDFGQSLYVSLSPVAGAANILCMLAYMGTVITDKTDPRIQEVLNEAKRLEHEEGINFRGVNNVNAQLLLAEKFGLRDCGVGLRHDGEEDKKIARNDLKITSYDSEIWPGDHPPFDGTKISLAGRDSGGEEIAFHTPYNSLSSSFQGMSGHIKVAYDVHKLLKSVQDQLLGKNYWEFSSEKKELDIGQYFKGINIAEARHYQTEAGALTAEDGNPFAPTQESREIINLRFTTPGNSNLQQAYGTGKTYEEAMLMVVQAIMDYRCFEVEGQLKAEGKSGLLPTWALRHAVKRDREREVENRIACAF